MISSQTSPEALAGYSIAKAKLSEQLGEIILHAEICTGGGWASTLPMCDMRKLGDCLAWIHHVKTCHLIGNIPGGCGEAALSLCKAPPTMVALAKTSAQTVRQLRSLKVP